MSASTIPAVVTALYTQAAAALTGKVFLGVPPERESEGLYLFSDDNGPAPAKFTQAWAGSGSGARDEEYDIPCLYFNRTGDNDPTSVATLLTSAMTSHELIAALFRPVSNLGVTGYTIRVLLTSGDVWILPTDQGVTVRIPMNINVRARI